MLDNDTKARQYCLAFQRPFADPDRKLQEVEKHALVVCSLAAIPPVSGMEGMEIDPEEEMDKWSSTKWAEHVRDVASRMATLSPPGLTGCVNDSSCPTQQAGESSRGEVLYTLLLPRRRV